MSDTPEIAGQPATTTPVPGSMSGVLDYGGNRLDDALTLPIPVLV